MGSCLRMILQSGCLKQDSLNLNVICLYIISMHQMDQNLFFVFFNDCVYWYTSEALGKWFVYTIVKRFPVKFLVYAHWFISTIIFQMKDHSVSVDQARYATSIADKYVDTVAVKTCKKFYKSTFPSDMIFTKADASTSDEKVENSTREFNINY